MADIKMSYIFIEKEKHKTKSVKEILLEIIDNTVDTRDNKIVKVGDVVISYRIIQKKNSERCFLEMTSKERVNRSISALQRIDKAIFGSNQQRYYHSIRDYDGISESFCKRLYPKYAVFERQIRSLVLFILTEAYGSNWQAETVSKEMLSVLQEKAHGNVSLNATLENMDLATLEKYLFEARHVDYPNIISEKLSTECLEKLGKEELCAIIEEMRPSSLWERHFEKFGSQESWVKRISDIHETRNKVAHQKTISDDEYKRINRKLNAVNRDLENAIEGIRKENYTEEEVVDILGSFAIIAGALAKCIVESQAIVDVIIGFNAKMQAIASKMVNVFGGIVLEDFAKSYRNMGSSICEEITHSEMLKNLNAINNMAHAFAIETPQLLIKDNNTIASQQNSITLSECEQSNFIESLETEESIIGKEDGL